MSCKHILASLAIFGFLFPSCATDSARKSSEVENLTAKVDELIKKKKYDNAEALLTPLISEGVQTPEAYCALGNVYAAKGDTAVALFTYYKSIEADSTYSDAYVNASSLLNLRGQSDESITILRIALEKNPNSSELMNALGCAYDAHGNEGDAMAAFKTASQMDPNNFVPMRNLGIKYLLNDELDQALECFVIAGDIDPNDAKLCNYLGLTYARMDNYESAVAQFNRAVALDKEYAHAFFNLGYLYEEHDELLLAKVNYERAAKLGDEPSAQKLKQLKFKNLKKKN